MLSKINKLHTQKGSLMIEALAMLGLISMVTPVIYKKAAERTTEMQDINAASQVRVIVKAIDDYLRDNYTTITAGGTVTSQAAPDSAKTVDYSAYDFGANDSDTAAKTTAPINIEHFRDYLPLGFRPDGKIFKEFDVVIKQTRDPSGERKALTTVLVAKTNADGTVDPAFTRLRSSRIASMIGTNGGFVDGDKATGVQGVWEIPKNELPNSSVQDGTIVATSIEAVADGTAGGKNVLHRVATPGRPEYNTMETALNMGGNDVNHLVNLIATADNQIHVKAQTGSDNVLLHVDGEGLVDSTLTAASENFIARTAYMQHKRQLYVGEGTHDNAQFFVNGADGSVRSASGNHTIDANGNTEQSGSALIHGDATIDRTLSALSGYFRAYVQGAGKTIFQVRDFENEGWIIDANYDNVDFPRGAVGISKEGNMKISGKIAAKGDVHIGDDVTTNHNAYSSGGKINMYADTGNFDIKGTFSAAYNENAYGDNTTKGAYNMQLAKNKFKVGASTSTYYPGYHLEVGNTTSDAVKLAATYKTNREGGTAATKYPAWKDHNLTVTPSYTYNEGTFYTGKRTSTTDVNSNNYQRWNNYNMLVTGTNMSLESGFNMLKNKDGSYNVKAGNFSDADYGYFRAGYNSKAKSSQKYMLDVGGPMLRLGDRGGTFLEVNNTHKETDHTSSRHAIIIGTEGRDHMSINPTDMNTGIANYNYMEIYTQESMLNMLNGIVNVRSSDSPLLRAIPLSVLRDKNNTRFYNSNVSSIVDETGPYGEYQVNPAYTSVMHDIKLATRGGARLSDILPDFINKGIYVMDNTYYGSVNWENATVTGGNGNYNIKEGSTSLGNCTSTKCDTSAWMGFIPTPNCPPGYLQVATITPIRFAMAQAGVPIEVQNDSAGNTGGIQGIKKSGSQLTNYRVLGTRKDPRGDKVSVGSGSNYQPTGDTLVHVYDNGAGLNIKVDGNEVSNPAPQYWADVFNAPYTFQVSTWLNTTLKAYHNNGFKGWHGIMGFIYPAVDYKEYTDAIGETPGGITDTTIIWNLFPVYKEELSAIATVYCYFDRKAFDYRYVDHYLPHNVDIGNIRYQTKAGSESYTNHLNDEMLKYKTVW